MPVSVGEWNESGQEGKGGNKLGDRGERVVVWVDIERDDKWNASGIR